MKKETPTAPPRKISPVLLGVSVSVLVILIAGGAYLDRPVRNTVPARASAEATAYLGSLQLSDVKMRAAENLMRQQVVYIDGKIANNGPRPIERIDVFCIFNAVDGTEVHRERVPVVQASAASPFGSKQVRAFELPFDNLPDSWNQAMPHLIIAQIRFLNE
jgi:hypothetical protein